MIHQNQQQLYNNNPVTAVPNTTNSSSSSSPSSSSSSSSPTSSDSSDSSSPSQSSLKQNQKLQQQIISTNTLTPSLIQKRKQCNQNLENNNPVKLREMINQNSHSLASSSSPSSQEMIEPREKRKEQNRNAQRAFRERKQKKLVELQEKVDQLLARQEPLISENKSLKDLVNQLKSENQSLNVYKQAFTFTLANDLRRSSMPISDIFQSNNQNQPICSNIGSNSTSTPATTTTTTTTSTSTAAANTCNNDDGLQLSSDHRQPSRSSNDSSTSYGPHSYQSNVQPSTLSLPQASIDIFSISNWFPALDRSLADSSQPNRLSSAPDPEKGLNVVQYRELDKVKIPIDYPVSNKPPPPQPSLAPLPATTRVKTSVPVQATAAGDGEKSPHSSIAFDDLNRFWTSSSNTDQASFNNRSLHPFTDPRRPEPIQPRQQQDLSKRPPQLFTSVPDRSPIMVCEPTLLAGMTHEMVSLNQLNYPLSESDLINRSSSNPIYQDGMVLSISGGDGNNNLKCFDHQSNSFSSKQSYTTPSPYINKFPRERSSIDTFRTIQPSIRNPSINNEFLTTIDRSRLSDNKNQTVFVETQATNEEMSLFEQQVLNHQRSNKMKTNLHQSSQMKQFLIEGRISEKELDDLCNMFDKKATCQERKNLWGQLVAIKPEWDVIGQEFKECYKKTCELTKNATIGIK